MKVVVVKDYHELSSKAAQLITEQIINKKIILLANGKRKARVIERTINGPITTKVPATVLQLHNDITVIVDQEAASQFVNQK